MSTLFQLNICQGIKVCEEIAVEQARRGKRYDERRKRVRDAIELRVPTEYPSLQHYIRPNRRPDSAAYYDYLLQVGDAEIAATLNRPCNPNAESAPQELLD
jgi:hypothetical protein